MTKLEKVVKGLECCKDINKLDCDNCPYTYNARSDRCECTAEMAFDALELLKERVARVLTLDEVLGGDECWFELRIVYVGRYADCYMHDDLKKAQIYFVGNAVMNLFELADYGKTWRCWNTRPTDEQREATPWNEPPKED